MGKVLKGGQGFESMVTAGGTSQIERREYKPSSQREVLGLVVVIYVEDGSENPAAGTAPRASG